MDLIAFPLRGAPRAVPVTKLVSEDFIESRAGFPVAGRAIVDDIVQSFDVRPSFKGDMLFPVTNIGTTHARFRNEYYVLYQIFTGQPRYKFSIKIWNCGRYKMIGSLLRFDFEDYLP
jgi:hypothetical protein